ncbi:MPN domain-containing protein isoform X2 [Cimex lectularius]|uniref:MPN domain-containing protein n=1 Tax=Cimex lectularius TaxID=79782 RepID=A0A8I6RUG3_CIMLE|nr:MPN domain-containing protein isoform X2 [Cimex lectularius]
MKFQNLKKQKFMQRGSEEEVEGDVEDDEFIDEQEFEEGEDRRAKGNVVGRTVTLQMLLSTDILQPGEANMSIEYMGQRFIGDLLSDGKIKSLETDIIFASPSAWACHCKRMVNPDKKSGCGWASVKYQGQKLDFFKNKYFKQLQKMEQKENEVTDDEVGEHLKPSVATETSGPTVRVVIKHSSLANRTVMQDVNTLVEAVPFSSMGKIQPFLVSLSTNAALVIDFHCHLTTSEVVGYLAGHWDVNAHNLAITHAFPCRSRLNDRELGPLVEEDICRGLEARRLSLVGWYHSHPNAPAAPTLRDIDAQLEYEMKMKGSSDATYTPVVGIICSPYHQECTSFESGLLSYWVIPPPESKPHDYGKPMAMTYSVIQDQFLSQDALNEMKKCAEFYKGDQDFINFNDKFKGNVTYLEKLKASLSSKFPRDQSDGLLWSLLSDLVCPNSSGNPPLPFIPPSTSTAMPITVPKAVGGAPTTSGVNMGSPSGYLAADIASALFATGKFPAALVNLFPPFGPMPPHHLLHMAQQRPGTHRQQD